MEGEILILSGSPGSGKTTAALTITAMPGGARVHLHADDFWGFIRVGYVPRGRMRRMARTPR